MKKILSFGFWFSLLAIALMGLFSTGDAVSDLNFRKDVLRIESSGRGHVFRIEIAETPQQHEQGLMNRTKIGKDEGMLFLFPPEYPAQMWMKNTLLPLDMLFIEDNGKIVYIAADATPGSEERISANRYVRAVLELPGGTVSELNIQTGDTVVHSAFTTSPSHKKDPP